MKMIATVSFSFQNDREKRFLVKSLSLCRRQVWFGKSVPRLPSLIVLQHVPSHKRWPRKLLFFLIQQWQLPTECWKIFNSNTIETQYILHKQCGLIARWAPIWKPACIFFLPIDGMQKKCDMKDILVSSADWRTMIWYCHPWIFLTASLSTSQPSIKPFPRPLPNSHSPPLPRMGHLVFYFGWDVPSHLSEAPFRSLGVAHY